MKKEGTEYTCDKCGKKMFVPNVDSRFWEIHPEIRKMLDGWNLSETGGKDFCPECNQKYQKIMKKFLEEG